MTFIESIYEELKSNHITKNGEEFSKTYLRKSPHYFATMRCKGGEATTEVLFDLATALMEQRRFLQAYDTNNLLEKRWQKWSEIEVKVLEEAALRITKQGTLPNHTLNGFKNALQSVTNVPVAA
jgi:hypothetical protein